MNFQLLRAYREHELELNGRFYNVRALDVEAALLTIHYSERALLGDEEARAVIKQEARRTLPLRLYLRLYLLGRGRLGPLVMTQLVQLGMEVREEEQDGLSPKARYDKAMRVFRESDWSMHIADCAYHFHMTPKDVLREPWPAFNEYIRMTAGLRARTEISLIAAKSLPYIERESERDKAFTDLYKRAGMAPPEMTQQEKEEEQRANLKRIASMMRRN